ncbi:uncharacterized protein LOC126741564 [Anthonomus grandis grandis]|uniref:uncharacterized protein LOC126741564 n=1 Tax=Anthonomus grandis grandis TaxID=2921223 RepID=UPI002164F20A|nr:uncharacterized protein LOC126741564 [Anthonomus grandis grandis]
MSIDKAVSTEDLCTEEDASSTLGVLRLEAILNTLVENKVEALKQENGKPNSLHSSPKSILQKLKYQQSSPKTTFRIENESKRRSPKRRERKERSGHQTTTAEKRQFKKQVLRQETSSPESPISSVDDKHLINGQSYIDVGATEDDCSSRICYCNHNPNMQMTDDYISIKMDGYGDIETDAIIAQEEIKRARRKRRRRRRKKRLKKRLALNAHLVDTLGHETEFKTLHDDELPPRAKWTIVATACLLLFMCLLLVGITLRMAPIIDEIVREENEKLINSLSANASVSLTPVHSDDSKAEKLYVLNGVT